MMYSYLLESSSRQNTNNLIRNINDSFPLKRESRQSGEFIYYDTFDWRLYRAGFHLYVHKSNLHLCSFNNPQPELRDEKQVEITEKLRVPRGEIWKTIKPHTQIRALLLIVCFKKIISLYQIWDQNKKTICRLKLEQSMIKDTHRFKSLPVSLELFPVRGYEKYLNVIKKNLSLDKASHKPDNILKRGLEVIDRKPADYSSKINIQLSPRMDSGQASQKIYLHLLEIIKKNEPGLKKDYDIEFLHDFRVAIRRTRSALTQLNGIFEEAIVQKAKENFSFLGKSTNILRDIDVYLLKESKYKDILTADMRQMLNSFFMDLRKKRKIEYRALIRLINSQRYKKIIDQWESFLQSTAWESSSGGGQEKSIIKTAGMVIRKRNNKMLDFGNRLLISASDELLHKLRIEGKKLRYLLEFFSSLYSKDKMEFLVTKLKQLQDNLGDYNDLVVQQATLKEYSKKINGRTKNDRQTILSIGILIGKMNEQQKYLKMSFSNIFSEYSSKAVQTIFHELFYPSRKGKP